MNCRLEETANAVAVSNARRVQLHAFSGSGRTFAGLGAFINRLMANADQQKSL
jgi:hypothetical protein